MVLTFASSLDRSALSQAADSITALVSAAEVGVAWEEESVLPGMTVGGLTRHLVSQFESAVEFLAIQPLPRS